jgi:glycosyltransferase involved in cell wall biosynthesis
MEETSATIAITTRNRKDELRRAIESALRQEGDHELLVLDDGSTDGTSEMVRQDFPQVRLVRSDPPRGIIGQRNLAMQIATHRIVVSMDDDAEFSSSQVVRQTLAEFDDPSIGAVTIPYVNVKQGNDLLQPPPPSQTGHYLSAVFVGCAHALRKDVFLETGGYREIFFRQVEEMDYCVRMLDRGFFVKAGRSDRILHFESQTRDLTRIRYFAIRNSLLYTWYNIPLPELLFYAPGSIAKCLWSGIRGRYPLHALKSLLAGAALALKTLTARQPVRRATFRRMRHLLKVGRERVELLAAPMNLRTPTTAAPSTADRPSQPRVGFLCFDLQDFTADCLSRIGHAGAFRLKAYPLFHCIATEKVDFDYRPSNEKGRFISFFGGKRTPEGFPLTTNVGAATRCIFESDAVVLFGIQGSTAILATLLARLARKPLVSVNQTLPAEYERQRRWWIRGLKRLVLRQCRVHVVQTPATARTLEEVYGISKASCVEAPFEAGAKIFQALLASESGERADLRSRFGWSPETRIFLFVGTLLRFKGIATLIQAAKILRAQHENFRVVLVGPEPSQPDEPRLADYQALASKEGVADRVEFVGSKTLAELPAYYKAADAFVLPTERDMWPKVLVEAALAGLPLITTKACGAAEGLVKDGATGYVVEPGSAPALAEAMARLWSATDRARLGRTARDRCIELCNPELEVKGFVEAVSRLRVKGLTGG